MITNYIFYSLDHQDIDECQQGTANCGPDEICKNKPGGYTCTCPVGHALNAQRRCEDVNECEFYKGQVLHSTRFFQHAECILRPACNLLHYLIGIFFIVTQTIIGCLSYS